MAHRGGSESEYGFVSLIIIIFDAEFVSSIPILHIFLGTSCGRARYELGEPYRCTLSQFNLPSAVDPGC